LGGVKNWQSQWFAEKASGYRSLVMEDHRIRRLVIDRCGEGSAISRIGIDRGPQDLVVTVNTARPGIVIGRGGQRVDELRTEIERVTGKRARLNIQEIRQPEMDAYLVARNVAEQLERRVAYRRALRGTLQRTMQAGAVGIKITVAGRLGGAEIARSDKVMEGRIPLHTLRADIDFAIAEAVTTFGKIGVKVWIYKGDSTGIVITIPDDNNKSAPGGRSGRGRGRRSQAGQGGAPSRRGSGSSRGRGRSAADAVSHDTSSDATVSNSTADSDVKKAVINEKADSPEASVEAVAPVRKRRAVRAKKADPKKTVAKETSVETSSAADSPEASVEAVAPVRKRRVVRAKKADPEISGESKKGTDE